MDPFRQFRQNVIAVEKKRLVLYESQQIQRHLTKKKKKRKQSKKEKASKEENTRKSGTSIMISKSCTLKNLF